MSDTPKIRAHVFQNVLKFASKTNLPRRVLSWTPELGQHEVLIEGPSCEIFLHGSREFRVDEFGTIFVHIHSNNPMQAHSPWLKLIPVWRRLADTSQVLSGVLDERGGKIRFSVVCILDPQALPAGKQ